jgi:hypothetical protein
LFESTLLLIAAPSQLNRSITVTSLVQGKDDDENY